MFDIVQYRGNGTDRLIDHNLGAEPEMIWVKSTRNAVSDWTVYVKPEGNRYGFINSDAAFSVSGFPFQQTQTINSSQFSIGDGDGVNTSSADYVAYLFATKAGVTALVNIPEMQAAP